MFESLSDRLSSVFRSFRGAGTLTEENVKAGLREVRLALLEADVNFKVVGDFVSSVREKCLGREITKGMSPAQEVVSVVNEELIKLLGGETAKLNLQGQVPAVIMMVGLQGSGKTPSAAKIANYLRRNKMRPYLVPADVYRPAAIKQLEVVGAQLDIPVFQMGQIDPVTIAKEAVAHAKKHGNDLVFLDTAGRLHVDEELMDELRNIKAAVNPNEILLVVDAMIGQDAVNAASAFDEALDITGVMLTKLDGDARGGAALSIKAITGKPIKFIGVGEKLDAIEIFHPDRMASRILGMGDVLSLIEKAQATIDEEKAKELEQKIRKNRFTLQDFYDQIQATKKMGSMGDILGKLPGLSGKLDESQLDDNMFAKTEAIILSMTKKEREDASLINASRRRRIAMGSGTTVADVNALLKQFGMMQTLTKQMSRGKMPRGLKGLLGGGGGLDMNSLGDMGRGGFGMGAHSAGRQRKSNKRKKKKR